MDPITNPTNRNTENSVFENLSEYGAVEKAFGIDLISEIILNYLIFDNDFKVDHKMVQTLRLVQKNWMKITSTLLKRSLQPIIIIKTAKTNISDVNVKRLNRFVRTLTSSKRLPYSLLPFKLTLTYDLLCEENHESFLKCLTQLGNELIELIVNMDGGTVPLVLPQFHFPLLRKISFKFSNRINKPANEKELVLLQQILNASKSLQELVLPWAFILEFPKHFNNLQIPDSVWSVQMHCYQVNKESMEVFFKTPFPNLKHLTLSLPTTPSESDILFKILERFQSSLTSFQVYGKHTMRHSSRLILKFPRHEKLERIQMCSMAYKVELQTSFDLQKLLPNVKCVGLLGQSEANLVNWIQSSKIDGVETLILSIVEDGAKDFKSVSLDMMVRLHRAFPNINYLEITVDIEDVTSLVYVFENMIHLKSLKTDVKLSNSKSSCWKYESVLVGLPIWLISAHDDESEYFQSYICKRGRKPSLLNLSKLTSFTLCVDEMPDLSDLLFKQIFLRMPKLRTITLSQGVKLTKEMEDKWIASGRVIRYESL